MHTSGPVNMDTAEKDRAKEKHRISKSKCVKRPWIEGAFFYPCEGDVLETKALMFRQEDLTAARLYRKKSWNQICFLLMWKTFLFHCRGEQWVIVTSTFFIIPGFYFISESDNVKGTHCTFNSWLQNHTFEHLLVSKQRSRTIVSISQNHIYQHSQNNMDIAG